MQYNTIQYNTIQYNKPYPLQKREWEESLREEDRQSGSLPGSGCPSPAESPVSIRRSNSDTKNNDTKSKKRKPVTLMEVTPSQFARHVSSRSGNGE